jgi:hypothetical protein
VVGPVICDSDTAVLLPPDRRRRDGRVAGQTQRPAARIASR